MRQKPIRVTRPVALLAAERLVFFADLLIVRFAGRRKVLAIRFVRRRMVRLRREARNETSDPESILRRLTDWSCRLLAIAFTK